MDTPDFKTLKKLADACRKAGIETFKGFGFEFTLAAEVPQSNHKAKKNQTPYTPDTAFETDSTLTDEELLFYSVQESQADQLAGNNE